MVSTFHDFLLFSRGFCPEPDWSPAPGEQSRTGSSCFPCLELMSLGSNSGPWGTSLEMYEITYYNNDTPHGLVQPGLIDLYDLCPPYGPMVSQAVAHPLLQSQNAPTLGKSASTFAGGFWSQYIYIYSDYPHHINFLKPYSVQISADIAQGNTTTPCSLEWNKKWICRDTRTSQCHPSAPQISKARWCSQSWLSVAPNKSEMLTE